MAEFEELRLTVNLVDNASSGLQNLRAGLGQLTRSTNDMAAAITSGVAGVTSLGTAATNAAPHVRTLNQHVREASRSAHELREGFMRMGVATQGLTALPQLAAGVRDMGMAVQGLGSAFSLVGATASVAVTGIAAVAVGVVAIGAVVIAYGVSVFKFAREMDQLSRTAKTMGLSFGELKYAQDQAKRFGQSAETVTRSYQGIQAAQFDLYKNNSQLRARLLGQGVDAGWIAQLQQLDPNSSRNAIIRYGKALEQQALDSGAMPNVAAALKNQFGKEFGMSKEDMAGAELPAMDPKTAAEYAKIAEQSKQISLVWNQIVHQWNKFSTEVLAAGLPVLLDGMKRLKVHLPAILSELRIWIGEAVKNLPNLVAAIPAVVRRVGVELKGVIALFSEAAHLVRLLRHPLDTLKKDFQEGRDQAHPTLKGLLGGDVTEQYREEYKKKYGDQTTIWDWFSGGASDKVLPRIQRNQANQMSYRGSNDNNPLLIRASYSQDELKDATTDSTDEVKKLTSQMEKLNFYFEQAGGGGGGGGGATGGGFMRASYTTGGYSGGGGNYGGASAGNGYGNAGPGAPAGTVDMNGKGIDPETMKQVEVLGRAGDTKGLEKLFANKGYHMTGPACGKVATAYVMSAGFKPPDKNSAIATNWRNWGEKMDPNDINKEGRTFGSMVATYRHGRYGGKTGLLAEGETGGHVMTMVPGSYNAKTQKAWFADQYGVRERPIADMDLRYAGDTAQAEVNAKRAAQGGNVATGGKAGDSNVVTGGKAGDSNIDLSKGGAEVLRQERAPLIAEIEGNPELKKKLAGLAHAEHDTDMTAVVESLYNRTNAVNEKRKEQGKPPLTVSQMMYGGFYGAMTSGAADRHLAGLMKDPKAMAAAMKAIDAAQTSNLIKGATDQGSGKDPNVAWEGGKMTRYGETYNDFGGGGGHDFNRRVRERQQARIAAADREALDRSALTAASKTETSGKLKAEVTAPAGTKVVVKGSGAFKDTETAKTVKVDQPEAVSI